MNQGSITREQYAELLRAKPYVPRHHLRQNLSKNDSHANNILLQTFYNANKSSQVDKVDLGTLEKDNRDRFGVKRAANVWRHEMDDNRISGDQIRTKNFRSTLFDREFENAKRASLF